MTVKLKIAKEDDRITVAGILIKNGYTVRQIRVGRGKGNRLYDYFIECDQQDKIPSNGGKNEG